VDEPRQTITAPSSYYLRYLTSVAAVDVTWAVCARVCVQTRHLFKLQISTYLSQANAELITSTPGRVRSRPNCDFRITLYVCPSAYLKNTLSRLQVIFYTSVLITSGCGLVFSDDNAIRYVLPVSWMT